MQKFLFSLAFLLSIMFGFFSYSLVSARENTMMCTMEYAPVCGAVQVQCIMAPCNPVRQTFSNSCMAKSAGATIVSNGECEKKVTSKKSPQAALRSGTWILESFNGKAITQTGTLTFAHNLFHAKLCNNVNGRYVALSSRLIFRNAFSTMMYCEGDIMMVENAFSSMNRGTYFVGDYGLTITTQDGDTMVWKK